MTNAFHLTPVDILSRFEENSLPHNFCIVPFTNLILNPGGKVSVCRQKGTDHYIGDLNNSTIEEIWNGEYLKSWRQEFLDGKPCICRKEIDNDQCHLGSGSYFYFNDINLDITQPHLPLKLTANFNGACNLKCEMCHVWTMENGFYDKINYWENLRKDFFPYIKEMELLSGEPFIQRDTYRLIDEISQINNDCIWSFTTNGHWNLAAKQKDLLDKIKIKNIIYSIDSLDHGRYQKIRTPGNLEIVLNNLNDMIDYNETREQKIALNFHFLVMQSNWDELGNIIEFCDQYGIMPILNYLNEPVEFSLSTLPIEKREEIFNYYLETLNSKTLARGMRIILSLNNSFPKEIKLNNLLRLNELLKC